MYVQTVEGIVVPPEQLYTTAEVAALFAVSGETIRDWINDKKLRAVKIGKGHYWRVPASAVEELANQMYGDSNAR